MSKRVKDLKVGDKIFAVFNNGDVTPYDIIKCNLLSADGYYRIRFQRNDINVIIPFKTTLYGNKTKIPYYDYELYLDLQDVIDANEMEIERLKM